MELLYIREILEGNTSRFAYFVETYKDMAYSVAFSVVNHKEEAEDVVQDAFVKAYQSLHTFRKEAKFSTWFYRIVVNTALTRMKRNQKFSDMANYEVSDALIENTAEAYQQLALAEQRKYIDLALAELNNEDRLTLTLYYLHECTMEEVSEISGIPTENLKMKMHRARKKMYFVLSKLLNSDSKSLM
ncbi:RNA polymerase sigma factor [Catalinimonas niigatensis]|uniref:RNA polymerase sigma factor n=1 Tax=Catalinimonas niigatensis TaxID=1397264 RepID=UPI002666C56B|nr:RNA polymerase sigma factor [Catalinimonas niigatensis]WPP51430.1 RNA polymerase sigma factor [Catalinimonas niigatensis]